METKCLNPIHSTVKQSINYNCIKIFQIRNTSNVNISIVMVGKPSSIAFI